MHLPALNKMDFVKTLLAGVLCLVIGRLGYLYYYGETGARAVRALNTQIVAQDALNQKMRLDNAHLLADIEDLKSGLLAIEEHARLDLGLIKTGEIFVMVGETAPSTVPFEIDLPEVADIPPLEVNAVTTDADHTPL